MTAQALLACVGFALGWLLLLVGWHTDRPGLLAASVVVLGVVAVERVTAWWRGR